jgi:hypothetical protein
MNDTTTAALAAALAEFQRNVVKLVGDIDAILPNDMPEALHDALRSAGMGDRSGEYSSALQSWGRSIREDLEGVSKAAGAAAHVVEAAQHRAKRGNLDLLS